MASCGKFLVLSFQYVHFRHLSRFSQDSVTDCLLLSFMETGLSEESNWTKEVETLQTAKRMS